MSALDRLINAMKVNGDDDGYYDDDYDVEPEETGSRFRGFGRRRQQEEEEYDDEPQQLPMRRQAAPERQVSVVQKPQQRRGIAPGMEVCVIKPTTVEEARELTDTLLSNRTVVLNLEGLNVDITQRIIDFTSGSCYAIRGNLMKISHYIFVVTPESVDISGDISAALGVGDDSQSSLYMPFAQN